MSHKSSFFRFILIGLLALSGLLIPKDAQADAAVDEVVNATGAAVISYHLVGKSSDELNHQMTKVAEKEARAVFATLDDSEVVFSEGTPAEEGGTATSKDANMATVTR